MRNGTALPPSHRDLVRRTSPACKQYLLASPTHHPSHGGGQQNRRRTYRLRGFDAGLVATDFHGDCHSPASQSSKTVYPDGYTVLTLCAEATQFILSPGSRGGKCEAWSMQARERERLCRNACACPFCIRDTGGRWTTAEGGEIQDVTWEAGNVSGSSPISGEPVRVWRGVLVGDSLGIEYSVSLSGAPHSLRVDSPLWVSTSTSFAGFSTSTPADAFAVPSSCPPPHEPLIANAPLDSPTPPAPTPDLLRPARVGAPPSFPAAFAAHLVVNISHPGYDGGNVLLDFAADCSAGPRRQMSRTTFGNFHTQLMRCDEGRVYSFDLQGSNCAVRAIPADVSPRVCEVCTLPFGLRDTAGLYTLDGSLWRGVRWTGAFFEGASVVHSGVATTRRHALSVQAGWGATAFGARLPQSSLVEEAGWVRTHVRLSRFSAAVNASDFEPPPCFRASRGEPLVDVVRR